MAVTSLPETVFAEILAGHGAIDAHECACGFRIETGFTVAGARTHLAECLAECLVLVGVEHTKGGQLYRVGRCPDDSPVYRIAERP